MILCDHLHAWLYTIRLWPRVKKIKNGYPESSKVCYSITLKLNIWCIWNHCIANFFELQNATRANKVWKPMCAICIQAFKTHFIISVTHYQIEVKLPFRNGNMFILMVLSISFRFKAHIAKYFTCNVVYHIQPDKIYVSFPLICTCHGLSQLFSHKHIITVQRLYCCQYSRD